MARVPMYINVGYVVPLILMVDNLSLGYGGNLAYIFLVVWIAMAVLLTTPEDKGTT